MMLKNVLELKDMEFQVKRSPWQGVFKESLSGHILLTFQNIENKKDILNSFKEKPLLPERMYNQFDVREIISNTGCLNNCF